MPASWQGSMPGRAGLCSAAPEASPAAPGVPEVLTVHEFLSRLVSNPQARSAFESDSRGSLEQAGLGEMTATDVLHATSLVLDYAPAEVVDEYTRSVHTSMEQFAAGHQYIAFNHPNPVISNFQEGLEPNMLNTDQILSAAGDVDELLGGGNGGGDQKTVDNSQQSTETNTESNTDAASGNEVNVNDLVGDVNVAGVTGGVTGLANSGDVNAGNVAGNGVTDVVGGVENTVGDVTSGVMPEAGDVTSGVMPEVGDVTSGVMAPVDATVGQVQDTAGDVTGGLGLGLE